MGSHQGSLGFGASVGQLDAPWVSYIQGAKVLMVCAERLACNGGGVVTTIAAEVSVLQLLLVVRDMWPRFLRNLHSPRHTHRHNKYRKPPCDVQRLVAPAALSVSFTPVPEQYKELEGELKTLQEQKNQQSLKAEQAGQDILRLESDVVTADERRKSLRNQLAQASRDLLVMVQRSGAAAWVCADGFPCKQNHLQGCHRMWCLMVVHLESFHCHKLALACSSDCGTDATAS